MRRILGRVLSVVLLLPILASAGVYEEVLNALRMRDVATVEELLRRGVDVNTTDQDGNSLLMLAAGGGDILSLELLLRNGAKVLNINKYGDSALMLASIRGGLQAAIRLVAAGAELDPDGWTPLIYAAFGGHTELVRYFLSRDVDIDAQAENGMSALMAASRNGHLEVVRLLVEHGADARLTDQNKLSALDMASVAGHRAIVMELSGPGKH